MRKYLRSRSILEVILEEPEPSEEVVPVAAQQPSDEQAQQEAPPTESQDVTLDQDNEDERAPEVPDADLEAKFQELALHKTGPEDKVKGASLPKLQFVQLPTAGPDPQYDVQELAQPQSDREGRGGPEGKQEVVPNVETTGLPDTGAGQPQE